VLVLLELVQIPLAYLLARRLRDREQERRVLLHRALDASEAERRRIARDLHDGPVQTLAGVAFSLHAVAERLNGTDAGIRSMIHHAAGATRQAMRELRSTLVDLYPASLQRSGLRAPLLELVNGLAAEGLEVHYAAPPDLGLRDGIEALLFRVTRESLQNVRKHAQATRVDVEISASRDTTTLTIEDDGRGFDPGELRRDSGLGLRLLEDAVAEAGGQMRVSATPGHGTRVRVEVPS
jgi:two-component system NarL family sensor kinase